MPQFPGGDAALLKYLSSHINYPPMAAENNVQGRVVVQFVVDKTGKVGEVTVVRSVDKELDREAVRVCKSLPKFVPGRQNGQPVSVWYTLPVTFKLQGTN
jgi:protein TonB